MTQQTIMITGATSGFGEAMARLFAQHGWKLILTGRRQERLNDLQHELGKAAVHTCCFDIRDKTAIAEAIDNLPTAVFSLPVVVLTIDSIPTATFIQPVVLTFKALSPKATLQAAVVLHDKAFLPIPRLLLAVFLNNAFTPIPIL